MYTIGQVSTMFDLPVSTLRYYDKEGFFPNLERKGNRNVKETSVILVIMNWKRFVLLNV